MFIKLLKSVLMATLVGCIVNVSHAAPGDLNPEFVSNSLQYGSPTIMAFGTNGDMIVSRNESARVLLRRLDKQGGVVNDFAPDFGTQGLAQIHCVFVMVDGRILVGGKFSMVDGLGRKGLAVLRPDGSVDPTFRADTEGTVRCILPLADGNVVVGGDFSEIGGIARSRIARLGSTGHVDPAFSPSLGGACLALGSQSNGRILVGGEFTTFNGAPCPTALRLSPAGQRDLSFNAVVSDPVTILAPEADGDVLIATRRYLPSGASDSSLKRVNAAGVVDPTFNLGVDRVSAISSLVVRADGKILVGGSMNLGDGVSRALVRLLPGGNRDVTFTASANQEVNAISLLWPGQVAIGGEFSSINGVLRFRRAKFENDPGNAELRVDGGSWVRWSRSGGVAEVQAAFFEYLAPGGAAWEMLGEASRSGDLWELEVANLPAGGVIRARGIPAQSAATGEVRQSCSLVNASGTLAFDRRGEPGLGLYSGNFGEVTVGGIREFDLMLKNSGLGLLIPLSFAITGPDAAYFSLRSDPLADLVPGESGALRLRYQPLVAGTHLASLEIRVRGSGETLVTLPFSGVAGSRVSLDFYHPAENAMTIGTFATAGMTLGNLNLHFHPGPGTSLTVLNNLASFNGIVGTFPEMPSGAVVAAMFAGIEYEFVVSYVGGTGNDMVLNLIGDGTLEWRIRQGLNVRTIATDADGQLFLATEAGLTQVIEKCTSGGEPVAGFVPAVTGTVNSMAVQEDGKLLVAGRLRAAGDSVVRFLVRLQGDGSLDHTFAVTADQPVTCLALQKDGKILAGGGFTQIGGVSRKGIARLTSGGAADPGFAGALSSVWAVNGIAVDVDGKIVVAGRQLVTTGNSQVNGVVRLQPNGTHDPSFSWAYADPIEKISSSLADGKYLVFDGFGLHRRNADGSKDSTFEVNSMGLVGTFAPQTDGKVIVGGNFTRINGVARSGLARLDHLGMVDEGFRLNVNVGAAGIKIGSGGRAYLWGSGTGVVQIRNTATDSVEVTDPSTVKWHRSTGAAHLDWAVCERFDAGGQQWENVGNVSATPGGWTANSPAPLVNCVIRFRGMGGSGDSFTYVENFKSMGNSGAGLVALHRGSEIAAGGTVDIGSAFPGYSRLVEFSVRNTGNGILHGVSFSVSGENADEFKVVAIPESSILPGESGTLVLRFSPVDLGERSATVLLSGNGESGPGFSFQISGEGTTVLTPTFTKAADIAMESGATGFVAEGRSLGTLNLDFDPPAGTRLTVIDNRSGTPITGVFSDLPQLGKVTAVHGGVSYVFIANYSGGDGNDLTLSLSGTGVPDPFQIRYPVRELYGGAVQPDGKILVGGYFSSYITRLLPDGARDPGFIGWANSRAQSFVLEDDGKILMGGDFSTVCGEARRGTARLNPDGSLDRSFIANVAEGPSPGAWRILKLSGEKVLIGGRFQSINGSPRKALAWVSSLDGAVDQDIRLDLEKPDEPAVVYAAFEQLDGRILIGGAFDSVAGQAIKSLVRCLPNGQIDSGFTPAILPVVDPSTPSGATTRVTRVSAIVERPDGKLLIGGRFTGAGGLARSCIALLHPDGSADNLFNASANDVVSSISLQADGKAVITGLFTSVNGVARERIARLNADGSLDMTFNPGANEAVYFGMIEKDGSVLVGGDFSQIGGLPISFFARISNDPAISEFGREGGNGLRWRRGGSAPELRQAEFKVSGTAGSHWDSLGMGIRSGDSWLLPAVNLPSSGYLRASGLAIVSNRTSVITDETLLYGRELTPLEAWRLARFGSSLDERDSADRRDTDSDGIPNLIEFAFDLNPRKDSAGELPAWTLIDGGYEVEFQPPAGVAGVTYGAEWSGTMNDGDWHPAEDVSANGWKAFRVPAGDLPGKFFRLKVSSDN